MASDKSKGQSLLKSAEEYWLECIKTWYPELHSRTYFLPPLHFNRVPYSVENIAGEQVLVPQIPQDGPSQTSSAAKSRSENGPSQTSSTAKSRSEDGPCQTSSAAKSRSEDGPCQTSSAAKSRSEDGPSQTSSPAKSSQSRSQEQELKCQKGITSRISGLLWRRNQDNIKLPPVYDKDVRDDTALQRVLYCLRELADNGQPKEVMMVISQLQFGRYLGEPSYAATAALLPRPSTLPEHSRKQHYPRGDFDVLIIHRHHGLFTLEIKSVGANFSQLNMTEEQEKHTIIEKIKDAIKQLNKAEIILKHLMSDFTLNRNVTKILAMPYISSGQLVRALDRNSFVGKEFLTKTSFLDRRSNTVTALQIRIDDQTFYVMMSSEPIEIFCQCLGANSVGDAVNLCLLSDQLSEKRTPSDVNHTVLKDLGVWWQQVVRACGLHPLTSAEYEQMLARFCGPATTVEVHCLTAPRLNIRILGEAVSETGEIMARLVLFPQQVELLNRSPPRVFLSGPPGTGKTIVLIMQGLTWLQLGHKVNVVSTCNESRAVTIVIEHQLKATMKTTAASSGVHRHQFYFRKGGEVETAVKRLKSLNPGRQLCVIADEAVNYDRKPLTEFCDQLIAKVPGVYLWIASVHHGVRPLYLEEVKLTVPLRSPPVVIREVIKSEEIKIYKQVHDYTVSDIPVPTEGPAVMQITHRDGQLNHTDTSIRDCVECGLQVARVLTELNVSLTGNNNGPPPLQYRDVLVLCLGYPTDDRVDSKGQVITKVSGLVRGLRASQVPVRVVEKGDEAAIRDTALGIGDLVTVTSWEDVLGLERKVVVVENRGDLSRKL